MPQVELTVGAEIPPFIRRSDFDAWNRYAAVNEEFVPIHMDDEAGRLAGFPSAIGMGNLSFAYLLNMLRAWMGEAGVIKKVGVSYRQPSIRKSTIAARGKLARVTTTADGFEIELDLWVDDDQGRVLLNGQAEVFLNRS